LNESSPPTKHFASKPISIYKRQNLSVNANIIKTIMPELITEWDTDKNGDLAPDQFLPQSAKMIWWKCENGHSWKAPIQRRSNGGGCPYCSGLLVSKGVNDLQSRFPHLVEQWDFQKNARHPDDIHAYGNEYAWWRCGNGHSWRALISNRSTHGRGCPYCSGFLAIPGETDLFTRRPDLAKEWDYDRNAENITYITLKSNVKAWWVCKRGHKWRAHVCNRAIGSGCPLCVGKVAYISKYV